MEVENQQSLVIVVPWLYCIKLETTLAFYQDVLGFSLRGTLPDERSAYVEYCGARMMVQEASRGTLHVGKLEPPFGRGMHLLFETPNVDELAAKASSASAVFVEPRNRWYRVGEDMEGHREVVVRDPDDYLLRFYHRLEPLEDA